MKVDGDYIGKFADPFYGYDPDVAFTQETTSYAAFVQDEWSFSEKLEADRGPAVLARHARGRLFRHARRKFRADAAGDDHLRPDEIFPNNPDVLVYAERCRAGVRRFHRAGRA